MSRLPAETFLDSGPSAYATWARAQLLEAVRLRSPAARGGALWALARCFRTMARRVPAHEQAALFAYSRRAYRLLTRYQED